MNTCKLVAEIKENDKRAQTHTKFATNDSCDITFCLTNF